MHTVQLLSGDHANALTNHTPPLYRPENRPVQCMNRLDVDSLRILSDWRGPRSDTLVQAKFLAYSRPSTMVARELRFTFSRTDTSTCLSF